MGPTGRKILSVLAALYLTLALGSPAAPARGAENSPGEIPQKGKAVTGPVNFDRAVRLALLQSPYITKSSMSIDLKRMDESDSKYSLIPTVNFRTQYYVNQPRISNGISSSHPQPYSLSFTSNNYNPVEAYLTLQGRKLLTQIAILSHMKVISKGLQKLGKMFLEMDTLRKAESRQENIVDLAQQNLNYYQKRIRLGTATSLEFKVASGELEATRAEKERIAYSRKHLETSLKGFLGMKPGQPLELDLKDVRRQVMGAFDPAGATLEQARSHSYELKIAKIKKELQSYNILLAKARLLPSFFFGMQSPDPLSAVQSRDLFFSVGLTVPVWDGFSRLRNVSRQKIVLRQLVLETDAKDIDLVGKWQEAQESLRAADVSRKSAQAQEELARLKERQSEIRYHSGGGPLDVYLEGRKNRVDAERNTYLKTLDYDLAVLDLRRLSGDLGDTYVDQNSWQQ
jgi:outer membrane protein TolC